MFNSGDITEFGDRKYKCVRVIADTKKRANELAEEIREKGHYARVTQRTKRYVPKETGYFAGSGGFTVETFCIWEGPKRK